MAGCGGCQGLGAHQKLCPNNPNWTLYLRPAVMAEDIGDTIGSNDPGLANRAYDLASRIKAKHRETLEERRARQEPVAEPD